MTTVLDIPLVADGGYVRRVTTGGILVRVNALIEDLSPDWHARLFAAAPEMAKLLLEEEYNEVFDPDVHVTKLTCRRCGHRNFDGHAPDCTWLKLMQLAGLV